MNLTASIMVSYIMDYLHLLTLFLGCVMWWLLAKRALGRFIGWRYRRQAERRRAVIEARHRKAHATVS